MKDKKMVKGKREFWDYVEMENDCLKCVFCGFVFSGSTSISRIKAHLSGVLGLGINICGEVPDNVKAAAFASIQSVNKRLKTMPSSSANELRNAVPTSSPEQTNVAENEVKGVEQETWARRLAENKNGEMVDTRVVQTEGTGMEQETVGGAEPETCNERRIEDLVQAAKVPVADALQTSGNTIQIDLLTRPCHGTRGAKLPTTELVGQAFKTKKDEILSLLMKDEVTTIGVWGMGGVGKTTLVQNITNQLLEIGGIFSVWITVSNDCEIDVLQDRIAQMIRVDLSKEVNERERAAKLYAELIKRQKFVLILDDLWKPLDVKEIGIPIGVNGCKLIFTTRSWSVCRRMGVCNENIIKVEPLFEQEAWTLFKIELGDYDAELEPLVKAAARECAGLPLGLRTMARSMRGVDDMSEWQIALEELKEAEKREDDMEPTVFRVLSYSYDRLMDLTAQECFLYCAFFPKDFEIRRKELIEYLIVEGIIEGKKSRQAQHDKGHVILNKLENACLLESCIDDEDNRCVKMHDLLRDMAIQKLRERFSIIKAGAQLRKIPNVDEWTESLVKVSLMENDIEEIPIGHSPRCPKLSTLLLTSNCFLRLIADSFFRQLHGLKVLDLSNTSIVGLPNSISELVHLVALLLHNCRILKYIPTLAKLMELQKLDLSETALAELPEGMNLLSNLRYLNLWGSKVKELPTGILPNLPHLQVLILYKFDRFGKARISITGNEVALLRKLESLDCYFEGFSDFRECMKHLSLCTYNIGIGECNDHDFVEIVEHSKYSKSQHKIHLAGCCIRTEQDFKAFPKGIEVLMMWDCSLPGTLFGDCSPKTLNRCLLKLKVICLRNCLGIKSLVSLPCRSSDILKSLETLRLSNLKSFAAVISMPPSLQSVGLFSCLKHFEIGDCHGVKTLFPIGILSTLQSLEILVVNSCYRMEEIQRKEDEDDDDKSIRLPNLKKLELQHLPELKSICGGVMICDFLEEITIVECPKLKRIPLSYPLPCLQRIRAHPKEWWESVAWGQHSDMNLLQLILKSSEY